jgi:hypothetical protein
MDPTVEHRWYWGLWDWYLKSESLQDVGGIGFKGHVAYPVVC